MKPFAHGHATHADWRVALARAAQQVDAARGDERSGLPTLGWLYFSDRYAGEAEALHAEVRRRWPGVAWVGACGIGVSASGVEHFDEPGLALMLAALPRSEFRVFSGAQPLGGFAAHTAQVHADPATPELAELIDELSARTSSGYLFGGLASGRGRAPQIADGVHDGGVSGVAFSERIALVSRVTQGCQPVGPVRTITGAERNVIATLDDRPALACLLDDLGIDIATPARALPAVRQTLAGLSAGSTDLLARAGQFGTDTLVRHLIGIDPQRGAIAIGDAVRRGMRLAFCQRDTEAARRDLVRICAEVREELEPDELVLRAAQPAARGGPAEPSPVAPGPRIAGAIYVSCSGRGGPHFGAPSAELAIVRRALGDVPLVGFFAAGEIARNHLYGYTGVLTAFVAD
jgi:small ligand-binding sensory domain FIST